MGSDRDHFVLTTRRNRRFIQSAETFQLLRCAHSGDDVPTGTTEVDPAQRSAGRWPAVGRTRIRELVRDTWSRVGRDGSLRGWTRSSFDVRWRSDGGGGDEETRTPDPLLAKEMLFQLSYVPLPELGANVEWWAFLDSNQRPLPYQGSALTS